MTQTEAHRPSILLLGNYRPSLTLARTMKKRGYQVIVGAHGCEQSCQYSNAVSRIWEHGPISTAPDGFLRELHRFCDEWPNLKAIYLVAEEYVRLFAENKNINVGFPPIVTVAADIVQKCLDKPFMMRLATKVNVPTAVFAESCNAKQFGEAIEHTGLPVVVRPEDSTKRFGSKKALTIGSYEALSENVEKFKLDAQNLLLQQKFEGKRHNIYFAAINGEVLRSLYAVIDRTDNPDGTGLAVEGRTVPATGPLIDQTIRLIAALDYTGIGCAQFLVDEETGASSFLEINPRIAGNHALPEHAGLDLGNFMLDLVLGNPIDRTPIVGQEGIRYAWTTGDIEGFKSAYLRGETTMLDVLSSCWRAVQCGLKAHVHMVYTRGDPMPAIRTLWKLVPRVARWRSPRVAQGQNTLFGKHDGAKS